MAEDSSTLRVDDFYFSALSDENEATEIFPISDSKYAEELQLQEALMSSVIASQSQSQPQTNCMSSSISAAITVRPSGTAAISLEEPVHPTKEAGESSQFFCEICMERREIDQMFKNEKCCVHSFCFDCTTKHITMKIQESSNTISCPGFNCGAELDLDSCRSLLPKQVVDRWEEALCEALILASQKFYCPFKDCSAMLVYDNEGEEEDIRESECPICHRLFCARCKVAWHSGIGCDAFQSLNEDERGREDILAMNLASEQKWRRCPHCRYYVEKTDGCLHIVCRCNFQFCYSCGSEWKNSHSGCQPN